MKRIFRLAALMFLFGLFFIYPAYAVTPGGPDQARCQSDCRRVHEARMLAIIEAYQQGGNFSTYNSATKKAIADLQKCLRQCSMAPSSANVIQRDIKK